MEKNVHRRAGEVKERARTLREKREGRRAQSREATVKERERERETEKEEKSPIELVEFYPKLSMRPSLSFSPHPLPLSPFRHLQSFILYLSLVLSTSQPLPSQLRPPSVFLSPFPSYRLSLSLFPVAIL